MMYEFAELNESVVWLRYNTISITQSSGIRAARRNSTSIVGSSEVATRSFQGP